MVGNGSSNRLSQRPSPAVYRRRRIVAGILALLVVIGVIVGITVAVNALRGDGAAADAGTIPGPRSQQSGVADPAAQPGATDPAARPEPSPTEAAAEKPEAGPALCAEDAVRVSATTDALSYPAGATPVLTMTVTNDGSEPCDMNVGTSQMEFTVASGSDRIFSSVDCQQGGDDLLKTIEPNSVETAKFTWERQRSAPGCAEVPSNPNPGTYMFTARLGGITSEHTVFELE